MTDRPSFWPSALDAASKRSWRNAMDATEKLAEAFLRSIGLHDAEYEPDGNVPPDFACGHIGIEVRRLNQHDEHSRGLEVTGRPLIMKCVRLLDSFGPASSGESWFVSFRYQRPIENWKTLRPKLAAALTSFRDNRRGVDVSRISVSNRFEIALAKSSEPLANYFVLGGYTDYDSGGWIAAELIKNLNIAIADKTKKIEPFEHRYREWWLVLLDSISHAELDRDEMAAVRENVSRPSEWARILLVNPNAPNLHVEL
jgi:hypothetical protein